MLMIALAALLVGSAAASERSVIDQLKRMAASMRSLSYEGTLVYLHDSRLETLHVVHRVEDGQVHEQIVSMNGPVRTVTREQDEVTCELADAHPFSVRRHAAAMDFLRSKAFDPAALAANYAIHPLGAARVAGRQAEVVGIIPRDELRYGYRFYLDDDTGLPLKSDLMGKPAQPVEQVMFTSLNLLDKSAKAGRLPADAPEEPPIPRAAAVAEESDPWQFAGLPPGFGLVMRDRWHDASGHPPRHFVLSDGLASISVYVENGDQDGLQGSTRIGAIHAVGGRVAGHQVTIVGQVPAATVEAVLKGLRFQGGTAR